MQVLSSFEIDTVSGGDDANWFCSPGVSAAQYQSLSNFWNAVGGVGALMMGTGVATPLGFAVGTSAAVMSAYNTYCSTSW